MIENSQIAFHQYCILGLSNYIHSKFIMMHCFILQDMNVIENLWASLKHHLRKYVKPKNKEELIAGIKDFWSNLTKETCRNYIRLKF